MTTITSAQANKLMQVALFTQTNRARSFLNMMTDTAAAPTEVKGEAVGAKQQTNWGAPVVQIRDLNSQAGDEVDMQIVFRLNKRPTMGDQKIEGRGENLSFGSFKLKINQYRHNVDAGGKMSQQRYKHNLNRTARGLLGTYVNGLQDQIATVHLAGARGSFYSPDDTILPLADHGEFNAIMVNPVTPPTYDRHFYAGDATSLENIDAADLFTLGAVDDIALRLAEMASPISPIKMSDDKMAGEDPFHVLFVTPRQWQDFWTSTSGKEWQQITAAALNRSKGWDHPIFQGKCAFWNGILIRQYSGLPIRFNQGTDVTVSTNTATAETSVVTVGTTVDRAILVGAQALASAYGNNGNGGFFGYHEEMTDHDNATEISVRWIQGLSKVRFANKAGRVNDYGVMVIDSAVSTDGLSANN